MSQIKRKFNNASYTMPLFHADMMLLFNNAKTYNLEDSWPYGAADEMQEEFEKLYAKEMAKLSGSSGEVSSAGGKGVKREDGPESAGASGTSTPMFKGGAAIIPPKIRINVGASKRREEVQASPESGDEDDDDDDDDDY